MAPRRTKDETASSPPMPTSLEGKLDLAVEGFKDLSDKLEAEQRSRRHTVVYGSLIVLGLTIIAIVGLAYGITKDQEHDDSLKVIDQFQLDLCGSLDNVQDFAVTGLTEFQESLIAASQRPTDDPRTPEEQAEFDRRVAEFREDLRARINALGEVDCEADDDG